MPRVLVTGASGFLGERLCARLTELGHDVHSLSRHAGSSTKSHNCDISDAEAVASILQHLQPECVFHLAAMISYSRRDRSTMELINVEGTRSVALACLSVHARLVHCSSIVAVGANSTATQPPMTEDSNFNLGHLDIGYVQTKYTAEQVVMSMEGLDVVVVNPSNIYGAGDGAKGSRSVQTRITRGIFPFYPSGGNNIVHVEDVVTGLILAWRHGKCKERYILGGENMEIKQTFRMIALESGETPPWIYIPSSVGLILASVGLAPYEKAALAHCYFYYSSSKAETDLGYESRPAVEAIKDSVAWIQSHQPTPKKKPLPIIPLVLVTVVVLGFGILLSSSDSPKH